MTSRTRAVITIFASIILVVLLAHSVITFYGRTVPQEISRNSDVVVYSPETRTGKRIVDGKEIEFSYTVTVAHTEQRTSLLVLSPTWKDHLRFWFSVAASVFYFLYALIVLCLWTRDKLARTRATSDTRDTNQRMDGLFKITAGVLIGVIGTGEFDTSNQEKPSESVPQVVEPMKPAT